MSAWLALGARPWWGITALRVFGLWLLMGTCAASATAAAGAYVPPVQPEVSARTLAAELLIGVYAGPDGAEAVDEAALREIAAREYRRAFAQDARTVFSESRPSMLPELARLEEGVGTDLLVRELELGRQLYRAGELVEATAVLESSLARVWASPLFWSRSELIAETLETLALAYQELASSAGEDVLLREGQTGVALRALIRLRPRARVDERRYPRGFVEAWRQAYFEQMAVSAAVLALRIDEARTAARLLDVDVVADLRLMVGARGANIALRVYDAASDRFAYDGLLAWDGAPESLAEQLSRAFSVALDCMRVQPPPAAEGRQRLLHTNFTAVNATGFAYLERPTQRAFANYGFRLGGQHYVTPVVGFFVDLHAAFSRRDRDGSLLTPIQLQALSGGVSLQYRKDRLRLYFDVGLVVARRTEIVATRSFWCRVSGGAAVDYGAGRNCASSEVLRQRASGLLGVTFRAGVGVRVVGPVWFQVGAFSDVYGVPFGHRSVDIPTGVQTGFAFEY